MLLMGKSTISTRPCSIANCLFTRGYIPLNMTIIYPGQISASLTTTHQTVTRYHIKFVAILISRICLQNSYFINLDIWDIELYLYSNNDWIHLIPHD
jgi:hypothetical protein